MISEIILFEPDLDNTSEGSLIMQIKCIKNLDQKFLILKIIMLISNFITIFTYLAILIIILMTDKNIIFKKLINNFLFDDRSALTIKLGLILIALILIFLSTILFYFNFSSNNDKEMLVLLLFLSFITINIISIIVNILFLLLLKNNNKNIRMEQKLKLKNHFSLKSIYEYTLIGLFTGLTIILDYITISLPNLPFGGGIELKFISLFWVSYLTKFIDAILTGIVSSLISILFIPKSIISLWQYLIDYFIPMMVPSLLAFANINFNNYKKANLKTILFIFGSFILIYLCHVISGIIFYSKYAPKSMGVVLYSFGYNMVYVLIFTYPIVQVVTLISFQSLKNLKKRFYWLIN